MSPEAIRALNRGAKMGNFHQDMGEGGLSKYYLIEGGNLLCKIGTAYFGCRTKEGKFDPEQFKARSRIPNVRMVEIKISQGAKPSHNAILSGAKVNKELAEAHGVETGVELYIRPTMHSTFKLPLVYWSLYKSFGNLVAESRLRSSFVLASLRNLWLFAKSY
ncbi:glutamate synthase-related protein [Candidatus Coxiella mudrowiae]|uniref:glutamate synthase-related protein n=1 Tax=Candidatus Coxiella mudrowiae TaxID=2054173 RepID=UPI000A893E29|nr:glutamate synthase-related protein [Candidatus Coxiella mudrowiae]